MFGFTVIKISKTFDRFKCQVKNIAGLKNTLNNRI